ncbi:helix-hairpin-helix domain-containing protein [Natrialbaceae archaeon A-gly3]
MAILQKLKSLLGLGDASSERRHDRDVGVTVERESGRSDELAEVDERPVDAGPVSSPSDESEGEPKESEDGPENDVEAPEPDDVPETDTAEASGVDDALETDTADVDESADQEDEPADEGAAAGSSASSSTDTMVEPTDGPEEAAEPAEATGPTPSDAEPTAEKAGESVQPVPVDDIKGIGPAYSDRLAAAGVETVSDLEAANAADLAEETDISEKRLQGWIDRAQVR